MLKISRIMAAAKNLSCPSCGRGLPSVVNQGHFIMDKHWRKTQQMRHISFWKSSDINDWSKAVSDAEKIVGYPTSFMSLRCLLSDELSNVAMNMRKLVGTQHPLLKTARGFVYDGKHTLQTRGLIVLLISKAMGQSKDQQQLIDDQDIVGGIHQSQRSLAEITEMIHTANLIHKGVVNLGDLKPSEGTASDMEFGNKMAVLSGDFLLANACTGLAALHNTKVVDVISSAIGELMEAEFTKLKDEQGHLVLRQDTTIEDWEEQTYHSSACLIAKSCMAAVELAGHNTNMQTAAYNFGLNLAHAYQLHEDLQPFTNPSENGIEFSLTSAPVILHLTRPENQPLLLNLSKDSAAISSKELYNMIKSSPALDESLQLCQQYGDKAVNSINAIESCEAKTALENIVYAVTKS